jgi:hypothetical protein
MAEERTLGLVRVQDNDDLSKEDLQKRLDETRQSISETVTEIKETVQHQVQAVKETLDWREQFKKRPVAWSAGALGVGLAVGYCIAANVLDDGEEYERQAPRSYAAQPVLGLSKSEDTGPGFIERVTHTPAYGRVKEEVGAVGNVFVQELSNIAKTLIVPAVITSLRNFLGGHLPASSKTSAAKQESRRSTDGSRYQPVLEHNQS